MQLHRYLYVSLGIALFILISFLIVGALDIPLLVDPSDRLDRGGASAALLGILLLVIDVLVPIPSSLVMTAQGALFGVLIGTLISTVGTLGAGLTGFWLGRRGTRLIDRFVSPAERATANRLLERWGSLALIVTRPVPVLAETVAITAGTSSLSWSRAIPALAIGSVPAALIYAIAGSRATSLASGFVITGVVIVLAALFWFGGRLIEQRMHDPDRQRAVTIVNAGTERSSEQ